MTLPGANSLVSISDEAAADSTTDLSLHLPPPNTSNIIPQAKIDPISLLSTIHVNTQSNNSKLVSLPKINTSPFLVANKQTQNRTNSRKHNASLTDNNATPKQNRNNKPKHTRDKHTDGHSNSLVTQSLHQGTLVNWLSEFRSRLGLDMSPCRYPSPNQTPTGALASLSDDEEISCYCLSNPSSPLDPYDLILSDHYTATSNTCYYTASPFSLLAFDAEGLSGVTPVGRWVWERDMFYSLRRLSFFRQARQRKIFNAWARFHSEIKMLRVKKSLSEKLYSVRPDYQRMIRDTLIYLESVCPVSSLFYTEPLSVLRENHLKVFWMDLLRTKSMSELRVGIREHFLASTQSIERMKHRVVDMLVEFACRLEVQGHFSTKEEQRKAKFSDVILNRKHLHDTSCFIKLIDLILHQYVRELCLIGSATLLSILRTSVSDAAHEGTYREEEQFRQMVLELRLNREKMSGQLQDISHGIIPVAQGVGLEEGLTKRRVTLANLFPKPDIRIHEVTKQLPDNINKIVDELRGPSPPLLRVSLQLFDDVTSLNDSIRRDSTEAMWEGNQLRLIPSRDEICQLFSDVQHELWKIANEYKSIIEYPQLKRYVCWFRSTSLIDNPPFPCVKSPDTNSSCILPLIDSITPDIVNEFVESAHSLSHMGEGIALPKKYRFKPKIYNNVIRKTSKRVRIEEDFTQISIGDNQNLDNFERSLIEYWDSISLYLEGNLNDIYIYCDAYQPYCGILNQCAKVLGHTSEPSETWGPDKFGHYIKFAQSQEECIDRMVRSFRSGAFAVETAEFYTTCKPYPQRIIADMTQHITKILLDCITKLMENIKNANFQLQLTINDISSCANHLYFLEHMQHEISRVEEEYIKLNRYMSIIEDYNLPYPVDHRVKWLSIEPAYTMMQAEFSKADLRKESTVTQFSVLINKCLTEISKETEEVKLCVSSHHFLEETSGYESVYLDLSRHMREVEQLLRRTGEMQRYVQQLFRHKNTIQKKNKTQSTLEEASLHVTDENLSLQDSELRVIQKEISFKQLLWSTWKKWRDLSSSWCQMELSKLDISDIQKQVDYFLHLKSLFGSALPNDSLWINVYDEVCHLEEILPVLVCVLDPSLQKRLTKLLKEEIDIHRMTLEEFLRLDIRSKKERILQENLIAVQERHSKELFDRVVETWSTHCFSLTKKNDVWLLVDVDSILSLLEESIMNLNFIKSSRFIGPIKRDVEVWDAILSQMLATIKTWSLFQQRWSELETIFSTLEMRHELSAIFRDFKLVDKSFQEFSTKYLSTRNINVKEVTTSPGILESFQSNIVQLERVSRLLDDFLENKRSIFGRLYFLSRDELLVLIYNPNDTSVLQPLLSKLFGSVHQLQLVSGYIPDISNIHGVVSFEGEVLKLDRYIPVKNTLSTFWIANLLSSLQERVGTSIAEAHLKFSVAILEDWIYGPHSGQAILVSLFITWTLEVEMVLAQHSEDWSCQLKPLHALRLRWQQQIDRIANTLGSARRCNNRMLTTCMIIVLTYFRDVLSSLMELPMLQGPADYNWCKVLRYYLDDPCSIWVEQFLGRFRYCNEYLGCSSRLVITPLTERAFRHMSTAMHFNMGTAFFGSAGTGKTETVRDFAKAIGNMCFSYSCSPEVSYRMLSQYLSGMCSSGTLCCFDDFHKLSTSVLHVVIHYMQAIKMCKDAKKESVLINAREVLLMPTSAYFITMNYLLSDSNDVHSTVLSSLRPCAMFQADDRVIAEVLLYSAGFTAAPELARKLSSLCHLAERNLSSENHYSFGLRSINQVIELASERKKVFYINWGNMCFPLATVESLLLIRCIQDSIVPRLLPRDQQLFHSLLSDHFPNAPPIFNDLQAMEKMITEITQEQKLDHWQPQVNKVLELFHFIKQSTGVMLVGQSGTGKTICLQILSRLMDMLSLQSEKHPPVPLASESGHRILTSTSTASSSSQNMSNNNIFTNLVKSKVFSAKINAKAFSLDEFYGKTDINDPDECLGIFPKILKTFLSDISPREETIFRRRCNLISKIEPREMVFEEGRVLYQPRDDKDLDNSGIPMLRTSSFKAKKLSDIVLSKEPTPPMKKKLSAKAASSQTLIEDALRKKSKVRKSESFEVEPAEIPGYTPQPTGKLSSLSKHLTASAVEEKQLPCEWRWIVFDGPIDPEWVEHLNPALDDTKEICLHSGERLKIPEGIRFIFETESLQFANPSIISRCSIVFLSEKDLGWKPLLNSWLNSLHPSVPDKVRTYLRTIANYSIPQALEFISTLHNQPLAQLPPISYVNTLCNIMTSFIYYLVDNRTFGDVTQVPVVKQWGHHVKSSSIISSMSGDTHYSTGIADKITLSLVFEQEEEAPNDMLSNLDPELLATMKYLPDSLMTSLNSTDTPTSSSLTYLQKNPDEIMNVIARLYLFAFVWSFGGPLDCFDLDEFQSPDTFYNASDELVLRGGASGRAKFDQFVYQLFSKQSPHTIDLPNSTRPIFSYYVDLDSGKFTLWESLVMEGKKIVTGIPHTSYNISTKKMDAVFHHLSRELAPTEAAYQNFNIVPTLDSVRTTFLISLLASRGYPILLAGQHASGVSMFMRSGLDLLTKRLARDSYVSTILGGKLGTNEFENVFTYKRKEIESNFYKSEIKLFFDMSANTMQHLIESQLLKRRNRLIGRNGKKLLLFLDDLNAPKSDQYNVSPCKELVSSLMDTSGLYERQSGQWRWVYDVVTMGTYRLTSNSTQQLTGKFLRRFSPFLIPTPSEATIKHIFGVAVSLFLIRKQFHREIILMADKIVSALTFLFKSACDKFQPTTRSPHYIFKIRDLAQIFLGMQQCTPQFIKSTDDIIDLFTHECNRVIHDRLTREEERREYFDILHNALRIYCRIVRSPCQLQEEQVLFGSISQTQSNLQGSYQPLPPTNTVISILDEHFMKASRYQLPVFFDVAVNHIMRICRVLTIPCAHMAMIGLPASGKRTGLSLASHLLGYNVVMPHKDGEHKSISEFDSLVKQLFREAGEKGVKSALYLPDRFLEQNLHILSYVSYVITQGCTTQFFSMAEVQEIAQAMECITLDSVRKLDSPWNKFVSSVNANFHVFISVGLSSRILSLLCREYPDVINHCTLNYFSEWPARARTSIAMKFLKGLETAKMVQPSMLKKIAETCSEIYEDVLNRIYNLEEEQCWKTYTTTASFIEMVRLFTLSAQHQFTQLTNRLTQLDTTVHRFSEADQGVKDISLRLRRAEEMLKLKEVEIEKLLKSIEEDKEQFVYHRDMFSQSEFENANRAIATKEITADVAESFEKVRPDFEEAMREIQLLKKSDIVEIRRYTHPPEIVQQVMTAMCILLQQPSDWTSIKHLLADRGFIPMIINFDKEHVPDEILEKLQVFINDPRFHPDNVDKVSGACKSICKWMFAIEKYCKVYRLYEPIQNDYLRSKNLEREIRLELKRAHENLLLIEQNIRKNEAAREKTRRDKHGLGLRLSKLKDKLKRANFLRETLEEEQVRCKEMREEEAETIKTILGDCLISSAGVSYLGPFPVRYRQNMLSQWLDLCWVRKIPVSSKYSFSKHLMSEEYYDIWYTQGLPKDRGSIENAVLIEKCVRWPLIIDPQQLANKWVEQRERKNNLVISDYSNVNLSGCIAMAIEKRLPLLIQNIPETLPLSLDTLLLREESVHRADGTDSISLFEKPGSSSFRLYMTCNLPFPRFKPYVYIRTNVINFSISEESMEDMLLSEAVATEEPELNQQRTDLLSKLPNCYTELWAIHDSIDSILQKQVYDILDNPEYTDKLAQNLTNRIQIKQLIAEAKTAQEDINKIKSSYGPIAKRGSLLYSIACDLSQLNHMYHFSIYWFLQFYKSCFKGTGKTLLKLSIKNKPNLVGKQGKEKIASILNKLTHTFYIQIGRAIFSEHLLPFSLTLCSKLLIASPQREESALTCEEWNFFLFGDKSGVLTKDSHQTSSNISHLMMPVSSIETKQSSSSIVSLPQGFPEITADIWKQCEDLEDQLPQAFTSLRQFIVLNARLWKQFMTDPFPFTFSLEPLDTMAVKSELDVIEEEKESDEDGENGENGENEKVYHEPILPPKPKPHPPLISGMGTKATSMSIDCDFQPDFLTYFHKLILVKELRKDAIDTSVQSFITTTVGHEYIETPVIDLADAFLNSSPSDEVSLIPILLIQSEDSNNCKDMVGDLEKFAEQKLGSATRLYQLVFVRERTSQSLATLKLQAMRGGWILCTNVHLQITWLTNIIDNLLTMARNLNSIHPNFRLWLITKSCKDFPISILHLSLKLRIESLKSIKANIEETLSDRGAISEEDLIDQGAGPYWNRLLFTLCFFNAVVRCRNRYRTLGWNSVYDFGIRDFTCAKYMMLKLMTDHSSIPWGSIVESLGDLCYGGRVTDLSDRKRLQYLLERYFNSDVTVDKYHLLKDPIKFPIVRDSATFDGWKKHIGQLPVHDSPKSLGLYGPVEDTYSISNSNYLMQCLLEMNSTAAGSGNLWKTKDNASRKSSEILSSLPTTFDFPALGSRDSEQSSLLAGISVGDRHVDSEGQATNAPLLLVLDREIELYQRLLAKITNSIAELQHSKNSGNLMSSRLEELNREISNDVVPKQWRSVCYPTNRKLGAFIIDLKQRCKFFSSWLDLLHSPPAADDGANSPPGAVSRPRSFWLSSFFNPNCFLTALKQDYSREYNQPLETIKFQVRAMVERRVTTQSVCIPSSEEVTLGFLPGHESHHGALVHGLYLEGCKWDSHALQGGLTTVNAKALSRLPPLHFMPILTEKKHSRKHYYYKMPVYYTSARSNDQLSDGTPITHISLPVVKHPDILCLTNAAILLSPPVSGDST